MLAEPNAAHRQFSALFYNSRKGIQFYLIEFSILN